MLPHFAPRVIAIGAMVACLAGCSSAWSDADRAKLAQVSVSPTRVSADAYQAPSAKVSPNMGQAIPVATGGGLIPALIGSAIDAGVTAHQQHKFEQTAAVHFDAIKQAVGQPPVTEIDATVLSRLKADPFWGPRLAPDAPAKLSVQLRHYGLTKSPMSQGDDVLLRLQVEVELTLTAGSDTLYHAVLLGVGREAAHANEIAGKREFILQSRQQAAEDLATRMMDDLDVKLGRKKPGAGNSTRRGQ